MGKSVRKSPKDFDKFGIGENKIKKMKSRKENKKMRGFRKRGFEEEELY